MSINWAFLICLPTVRCSILSTQINLIGIFYFVMNWNRFDLSHKTLWSIDGKKKMKSADVKKLNKILHRKKHVLSKWQRNLSQFECGRIGRLKFTHWKYMMIFFKSWRCQLKHNQIGELWILFWYGNIGCQASQRRHSKQNVQNLSNSKDKFRAEYDVLEILMEVKANKIRNCINVQFNLVAISG